MSLTRKLLGAGATLALLNYSRKVSNPELPSDFPGTYRPSPGKIISEPAVQIESQKPSTVLCGLFSVKSEYQLKLERDLEKFIEVHPDRLAVKQVLEQLKRSNSSNFEKFVCDNQKIIGDLVVYLGSIEQATRGGRCDLDIIKSYINRLSEKTNLDAVEGLFERGYFKLLHQVFLSQGACQTNWLKNSKEIQYYCIGLAISAREKEFVNYLINIQYNPFMEEGLGDLSNKFPDDIADGLIPYLVDRGFIDKEIADEVVVKISSDPFLLNIERDIVNHINWGESASPSQTDAWSWSA